MSKWEDQLSGHEILNTLSDLSEKLKDDALVSQDIDVIELVEKMNALVVYADSVCNHAIPELINMAQLNKANAQMTNVRNEVNNFIANSNVAHLNNAVSHVDATMAHLIYCPLPQQIFAEEMFVESLSRFKSQIKDSLSSIRKEKDELIESVRNAQGATESHNDIISTLSSKIDAHSESIDKQVSDFNDRYESLVSDTDTKIESALSKNSYEISELLGKWENGFSEAIDKQRKHGDSTIRALSEYRNQASDLVQIIGNIGITGNYQKIANDEKKAADKWRNIALSLMIVMVLVIGVTVAVSATNGFDWKLALFRIGAALILAIPATYAAKESTKHRILENSNRKAELELASLDPFLEKLPEASRHKVKEELTTKFFGAQTAENNKDETISYSSLIDLLKMAISKK